MTLKHHQTSGRPAVGAIVAMLAMLLALLCVARPAFGYGLEVPYVDSKGNVCEGVGVEGGAEFETAGCPRWRFHVKGKGNAALTGESATFAEETFQQLTTGNFNLALDTSALASDTTGSNNVASGYQALFANTEGSGNIAVGTEALKENTANDNVASGDAALRANTSGQANIAVGTDALIHNTTASKNDASGFFAMFGNTTGSGNTAFGTNALQSNTTGEANVALGDAAGFNITGSENIDIANEGAEGESGTTRIGTEGKQTRAFVGGIWPTTITGPVCVVKVNAEGQVGCNPTETGGTPGPEGKEGKEGKPGSPGVEGKEGKEGKQGPPGTPGTPGPAGTEGPPGKEGKEGPTGKEGKEGKVGPTGPQGPAGNAAIATFASFEGVASGHCLNYAEVGDPGTASCPSKTSGFASGRLLAGPTPANGATATNLFADSNASVSGKDSVLVAVIDNTTGANLLSCTVNSTNKNNCSNSGSSGLVAPGDNIEVKLTASGSSGNEKQWRVRFRY